MGTFQNTGEGIVGSGEKHHYITPSTWTPADNFPLCLVSHGLLSNGWTYREPKLHKDLTQIANSGFIVLAADFSGAAGWNTDAAMDSANATISWAENNLNANTNRVSWVADSMGTTLAMRWAWYNPNKVGGMVLRLSAINMGELVTRDPSGVGSTIVSAFGGSTGWDDSSPFVDPAINTGRTRRLADRILFLYSEDDPITANEDKVFSESIGSDSLTLGSVSHDPGLVWPSTGPEPIPANYQAQFLLFQHNRAATTNESAVATEETRWKDLIKQGDPFSYKGGDITDSVVLPEQGDGKEWVVWVGSDLTAAGGKPPTGDTIEQSTLPLDNGIIIQEDGVFSHQIYESGTDGRTVLPSGSFPDRIYWMLGCCVDDGKLHIACALVDRSVGTYGSRVDSHILTLDPADLVAGNNTNVENVTVVNSDMQIFDILGLTPSVDGYIYITGGEFIPEFDDGFGLGDISQSFSKHRIARVPKGKLQNVSEWTYWTGSGWSHTQSDATPIKGTGGADILGGDAGLYEISSGNWLMAEHQLIANDVNIWKASSPVGPWSLYKQIPVPDFSGTQASGYRIGQFARFAPHTPGTPSGHVMVHLVPNTLQALATTTGQLVSEWSPRFIAVPVP